MKQQAKTLHKHGLKVIPFWDKKDGSKIFPANYAEYRNKQTDQDIEYLFRDKSDGIALLCTDGIEVIDIDLKHDSKQNIDKLFFAELKQTDIWGEVEKCVIQKTKSGGWHLIYRTEIPDGNTKLATRPGSPEAVLETRGKGGLIFVAPTPNYEIKKGSLTAIPKISDKAKRTIFQVAKSFDTPEQVKHELKPEKEGLTPWDDFNMQSDLLAALESYGWRKVRENSEYIYLNRPGAKHSKGVDASIIKAAGLLYVWSTSTKYEAGKAYSAFSVLAHEEYGGDHSRAAKYLYENDYGDRQTIKVVPDPAEEKEKHVRKLLKKAMATRFDNTKPITELPSILDHVRPDKYYKVGGLGMIGAFSGHEKSGKTYVVGKICSSGIRNEPVFGWRLKLNGKKLLYLDTEQSEYFYQLTQKRILEEAGYVDANCPQYDAYHLRQFPASERFDIVQEIIYSTDNLGCVVIDGYVDLMNDYNDLKESQEVLSKLMKWTDEKKFLLMGVLHVNKGDGKLRGHLGSELKNKADFVVKTQKQDDRYLVSNPTARFAGFRSWTFYRPEDMPAYTEFEDVEDSLPKPFVSNQFPSPKAKQNGQAKRANAPTDYSDVPF